MPALFHREDRRPLKLATMGALACHFALFLVVFPGTATPELVVPRPQEPLVLQPLPLPPPPTPETPAPARGQMRPMPTRIVEPVRFVPQPLVDREALDRLELPHPPASAGFEVGVPVRPPAPPRARVRAGVDVLLPQLLERVEPVYPQLAVRAGVECVVTLEAVIGKAGEVIDTQVLRGCRLGFDESALAAVQQWRFTPSTLNGRPVEVIANFTVRFRLH